MFDGTSLFFRLMYFFTAVTPASIMLSLQLKFDASDRLVNYGISLLILDVSVAIALKLKAMLINRVEVGVQKTDFSVKVVARNGDVVTFLFGVIIPSVLLPEGAENVEKVVIFSVVQLLVYIISIRTTSILPNVLLMILGVDIYQLSSGSYVFSIGSKIGKKHKDIIITRLGDDVDNETYIFDSGDDNGKS